MIVIRKRGVKKRYEVWEADGNEPKKSFNHLKHARSYNRKQTGNVKERRARARRK